MSARPFVVWRAAWTVVLLAAGASAQAPIRPVSADAHAPTPSRSAVDATLRGHDRARIHPGNPLALVGIDQGDNAARASTPALVNRAPRTATVDADENYRRTLALYEHGASFHVPLALAAPVDASAPPAAAPQRATDTPGGTSAGGVPAFVWALAAILVLGTCAWISFRRAGDTRAHARR